MIDLTNKQFGRLVVLKRGPNNKHKQTQWVCQCVCGVIKIIPGTVLKNGKSKSCGCLALEVRQTHKLYKSKEYSSWHNMISRCNDINNINYGGKGIVVCERWTEDNGFIHFLEDMGFMPNNDYSIDRLDGDDHYYKDNCRWATDVEQSRNKKNLKIKSLVDASNIRLLYRSGNHTYASLSRLYDCDSSHIRRIILNERWKN